MQKAELTLMAQILTTPWWLQLIRGIIALVFGLYAVSEPALTLVVMVQFLGAFVFVEGIYLTYLSIANRTGQTKRGFALLRGLVYVLAGLTVLFMPVLAAIVTSAVLGSFVGILAFFGGVMEISAGIRTEKDQPSDWGMILLGVLSLVFGLLLLSAPLAGGVGLSLFFGIWSLVTGVFMIVNSFRIRSGKKKLEQFVGHAV